MALAREVKAMELRLGARDAEAALDRCRAAARGEVRAAQNQREANVFCLSAMVLRPRFPRSESMCLMRLQARYEKVLAHLCRLRRCWNPPDASQPT